MGLLEPSAGEILIDGVRLDDATRADWQAGIAHVPQFIYLADSSIAENIAFGIAPDLIDLARIRAAAAEAQLTRFVETLPDGYATRVGERGVRLSGGQRQRLGIARALYKQPSVLILDEATSALDNETEAAVMAALSSGGRRRTVLIVAHRLTSLASCDRLVRLHEGAIVEEGSFESIVGERARKHAS
jgi:ABC-type multidrug transport system fused ATPase/permease subunit